MSKIDEEVLDDDPDSLAVEADGDAQYELDSDSQVVAVEPLVITKGRAKRKQYLNNEVPDMQNPSE